MQIKQFAADTIDEVLAQVRAELGEDAMILQTKRVVRGGLGGFFGREGVEVTADERYFRVDVDTCDVAAGNLTDQERKLLVGHRWFTRNEIAAHDELLYPADLVELLDATETRHAG